MNDILCIATWAALSISMSLYNKWILSYEGFKFPISLGFLHMLGAWVAFQTFALWKKWSLNEDWPRPSVRPQWPVVILAASLFSISISLRNIALETLPLSFSQLLASLAPMCTYLLSVAFGFTKLTGRVFLSLSACVFGVWVGLTGTLRASWRGVTLQATGIFVQTLQVVLLQKLMTGRQDVQSATEDSDHETLVKSKSPPSFTDATVFLSRTKSGALTSAAPPPQRSIDRPTPAEMLAFYAPCCAAFLFFPMCAFDLQNVLLEVRNRPPLFCFVIAGNVAAALALNVAVATCIHRSNAMNLSLCGLAKDWTVVVASNIIFGREITLNFVVGMTIVTFSLASYACATQKRSESKDTEWASIEIQNKAPEQGSKA